MKVIFVFSTLLVFTSAVNPLIVPVINGILTTGIDFLLGGSNGPPPIVDLSEESIKEISQAVNMAVSQSNLNEYLSDANAILGSLTYYTRSNSTYALTSCGDTMANYDSNRIRKLTEDLNKISKLLSSRNDFGFSVIPTYMLVASTHLAMIREQIGIKKDLVKIYEDDEESKKSFQEEVGQFQQNLHEAAQVHKGRLEEVFKPRFRTHTDTIFRVAAQKKGKCRGGRRTWTFKVKKLQADGRTWDNVYTVGTCRGCYDYTSQCRSVKSRADNQRIAFADREAKSIADNFVSNLDEYIQKLQEIVETPLENL